MINLSETTVRLVLLRRWDHHQSRIHALQVEHAAHPERWRKREIAVELARQDAAAKTVHDLAILLLGDAEFLGAEG